MTYLGDGSGAIRSCNYETQESLARAFPMRKKMKAERKENEKGYLSKNTS